MAQVLDDTKELLILFYMTQHCSYIKKVYFLKMHTEARTTRTTFFFFNRKKGRKGKEKATKREESEKRGMEGEKQKGWMKLSMAK